jgi:hypothetical protein
LVEYNDEMGKLCYKKRNRGGWRKEIIVGYGLEFDDNREMKMRSYKVRE